MSTSAAWPSVTDRHRGFLPVTAETTVVTLCEGDPFGRGLRDPDTALESASRPMTAPARLDAVLSPLGH